jgi:RecQ family ATP-dependent DNA helicase
MAELVENAQSTTESTEDGLLHPPKPLKTSKKVDATLAKYNAELNRVWGYDSLKPEQYAIIKTLLEQQKDVCAILATGFGKSICYQLPVLIAKKCVIVISPLIALMHDQYAEMLERGVPVCSFNSSTRSEQYKSALISGKEYKLIYMTPEYFVKSNAFVTALVDANNLCMVAIDEAHAVSTWGHDFRASYVQLSCIRNWIPTIPILTLTATASTKVKNDIISMLGLRDDGIEITGDFNRPNLYIEVKPKTAEVLQDMYALLLKYLDSPKIIYCLTRDDTVAVADAITQLGIPTLPYHAGLPEVSKKTSQDAFINGTCKCIVATIAFGMGINVKNVRLVIHYNCPKNLENYYQEIGRAGRDGLPSECHLFHSAKDFKTARYFNNAIENAEHKEYQDAQTRLIERYVYSTECRRKLLLASFGQTVNSCPSCDNCFRIANNIANPVEKVDYTKEVFLVLSAVSRVNEKFGSTMIINILLAKDTKIKDYMVNYGEYGKGVTAGNDKWWGLLVKKMKENDFLSERTATGFFGTTTCLSALGKETLAGLKAIASTYDALCLATIPKEKKIMFEKIEIETKTKGRKPKA